MEKAAGCRLCPQVPCATILNRVHQVVPVLAPVWATNRSLRGAFGDGSQARAICRYLHEGGAENNDATRRRRAMWVPSSEIVGWSILKKLLSSPNNLRGFEPSLSVTYRSVPRANTIRPSGK